MSTVPSAELVPELSIEHGSKETAKMIKYNDRQNNKLSSNALTQSQNYDVPRMRQISRP